MQPSRQRLFRTIVGLVLSISSFTAIGDEPADPPKSEAPIITMETAPVVMEGPNGEKVEVRGEYTVIHVQNDRPEQFEAAKKWVAAKLKEVHHEYPDVKQDIFLLEGVPEKERERYYASEEAYRISQEVFSGSDTLSVKRLEDLQSKSPRKLRRWKEAADLAKTIGGAETPFYIGMVPHHPVVRAAKFTTFVIMRVAVVGYAVYTSVRIGDDSIVEKALVVGGVCAAMSGYLMAKFKAFNTWLGKRGFLRPNIMQDAGLPEKVVKTWSLAAGYYGVGMLARWITGLDSSFSGPFKQATQGLVTEAPAAIAMSEAILKRLKEKPDLQNRTLNGAMTVQIGLSALMTSLMMSNMAQGSQTFTVQSIALYSIGLVGSYLVLKPKIKAGLRNLRVYLRDKGFKEVYYDLTWRALAFAESMAEKLGLLLSSAADSYQSGLEDIRNPTGAGVSCRGAFGF